MAKAMEHWYEVFEAVRSYVFLIETPEGSGTGFYVTSAADSGLVGIATAGHVVEHAFKWDQPIRVYEEATGKSVMLTAQKRAILGNWSRDAAAILCAPEELPIPKVPLAMIAPKTRLKVGVAIVWMGFPGVTDRELCLFSGRVSRYRMREQEYLVDGVAINGVSGGPAFDLKQGAPRLIGLVSAYIPNRLTGGTLPGLCVMKDIASLKDQIETISSLGAAKEEEQSVAASLPTEPPSTPPAHPSEPARPSGDPPVASGIRRR